MPEFAPQIHPISRLEKRTISVDCSGNLEGSSVVVGTPTVDEVGTSHLVIADVQASSTLLEINGRMVPAGQAILFTVDARGGSVRVGWVYSLTLEFDADTGDRVAGGVRVRTD
jgi:hypothetical protein